MSASPIDMAGARVPLRDENWPQFRRTGRPQAHVERTLHQFLAQAIPDSHPSMPELNRVFGDHIFFLDDNALHIGEPMPTEDGEPAGKVVKLASWQDPSRTSLAAHRPQPTDVIVELGSHESLDGTPDGINMPY